MEDFEILKTYVNTLETQLSNFTNILTIMTSQVIYLKNFYNNEKTTYDIAKIETKSGIASLNVQSESIISQKNIVQGLIDTISSLVN